MTRATLLGVVALLCFARAAVGQSTADPTARSSAIDAGDVATIVLQVPAGAADSARYVLALENGYRPFIATEGRVARHRTGTFIVPVAFATPRGLPAGDLVAGTLRLLIDGHEPIERGLVIRVRERRAFDFQLDLDEARIAPDGLTGVPYRIHNRGNRPDTVRLSASPADGWTLLEAPLVVVAPGDSAFGALRISAPVSVAAGDRQLLAITARSGDRSHVRTVNLVVVSPTGWLGGLAHVPSSLFVGQALGESPATVAALSGAGRVAPDTDVRIDLRYAEAGIMDPALQRQLGGARLRLSVSRPDLRAAVGDVYTPGTTLTGSLKQARGLEVEFEPAGPLSGGLFLAVPTGLAGDLRGGHIVQAHGSMKSRYGEMGLLVGDMFQPVLGRSAATRSTGGGVRWSHVHGPHSASAEATIVRMASDTIERVGPALELGYLLQTEKVSGGLRARRIPGAATLSGGQGNEVSASFSAEVLPSIHAVAWAFGSEQKPLVSGAHTEAFTGSAALRARRGALQGQLGARVNRRSTALPLDSQAVDVFAFERRTARGEASYVRGAFSFAVDAEAGVSRELGREGLYRALGSGLRWYGAGRAAWGRVSRTFRPGGLESTVLQTGGRLDAGRFSISGGLNTSVSGDVLTSSLWSATEIDVARNLAVLIGASARGSFARDDWSFSLGVRRRLNLPLPVARYPDLHGVVFDDANGNGIRDPDEAGLGGVGLALGYLEETTDADGTFAFRDATGMPLRIRSERLPLGYVVGRGVVLPTTGQVDIPLVRTATLHLELFLDRDEDGQHDPAESVGDGVVVVLTDAAGGRRSATADASGQVRVSGLRPGRYEVTAQPPSDRPRQGNPEVLMEVRLAPGAEVHHTLAVPLRRRTIRMGN